MKLKDNQVMKFVNDEIFKSVLSSPDCFLALCLLISETCNISYNYLLLNIRYSNTELKVRKYNEKVKRSDLILETYDKVFIIEMNRGHYYKGLFVKNYSYANEVNLSCIKKGMDYSEIKDIYLINIDEFDSFNCNLLIADFPRYNNISKVTEKINIHDKHVILENVDKDKYNKYSDTFIKLIKIMTTDEKDKLQNLSKGVDILENVVNKLIDLSEDEDMIGLYDLEERRLMELNTIKNAAKNEGLTEGHKQGLTEGHKQGLSEGSKKTQNSIAKNLLKLGMKIEEISKATGLSINQIKML